MKMRKILRKAGTVPARSLSLASLGTVPGFRLGELGMVTRRGFMAAVAAGVALGVGAEESAAVRVGIVGVGNRGSGLLHTLLELEGVTVCAVCDVVAERAAAAQAAVEAKGGARPEAYTGGEMDYERMLARGDLDAVIVATPWDSHARIAVAAMKAGVRPGVEVPAALTVDECWELVRASRDTGVPCMMLENVCYFQNALTILRMVREGLFGEMLCCEGGYQHDCRFLLADDAGNLTWRGRFLAEKNGNQYPTHPIGPIAQWLDIGRGDRFTHITSVSTAARGINAWMKNKFGAEHPLATRAWAQGDVNTTILRTAKGRTVTLYFDLTTHRPYDLVFRAQGVNGLVIAAHDKACIENVTPGEDWAPFEPLLERYPHPTWERLQARAQASGGHGGADYITLHEFVDAVRRKAEPPQDVFDAAVWSAVVPLTMASVAEGGRMLEFPDFTEGAWERRAPLPIA